jgi:hypothetical protein
MIQVYVELKCCVELKGNDELIRLGKEVFRRVGNFCDFKSIVDIAEAKETLDNNVLYGFQAPI